MRYLTIIILCILVGQKSFSQINPGAKQISLSHSDIALSNDVFAIFNNPAGLAQIDWREVGVYYSPSPFGLTELANGYIAYNEPFSFGSISIGGMSYGFNLYRENKILAGFSYNYLNKFFGGIVLTFHTVSIKNYGNTNAFYLNLGGLIYLSDEIRWGFTIHNLNRATFGNEEDQIPIIFSSGFSIDIINNLSFNAALEKDIVQNASLRFGIEYEIIKYISIRTGFQNEPSLYSAGLGINYSFFNLDYAVFNHPDLGLTHQAGIIISFGKKGSRSEIIKKHLH